MRIQKEPKTLYNDDLFGFLEHESLNTFLNRYTIGRNESTTYHYEKYIRRGGND